MTTWTLFKGKRIARVEVTFELPVDDVEFEDISDMCHDHPVQEMVRKVVTNHLEDFQIGPNELGNLSVSEVELDVVMSEEETTRFEAHQDVRWETRKLRQRKCERIAGELGIRYSRWSCCLPGMPSGDGEYYNLINDDRRYLVCQPDQEVVLEYGFTDEDGVRGTAKVPVTVGPDGIYYRDLWVAADKAIGLSMDMHHCFVENFSVITMGDEFEDVLRLRMTTGS